MPMKRKNQNDHMHISSYIDQNPLYLSLLDMLDHAVLIKEKTPAEACIIYPEFIQFLKNSFIDSYKVPKRLLINGKTEDIKNMYGQLDSSAIVSYIASDAKDIEQVSNIIVNLNEG